MLREGLLALTNALLPVRCVACSAPQAVSPLLLCTSCDALLRLNDGARCPTCDLPGRCRRCEQAAWAFASIRAPFLYDGVLAELIAAMKFSRREDVAWALGRELGRRLLPVAATIVPVPLGKRRRRQRGFNQSAILARALAQRWQAPLCHALVRVRETSPQSELAPSARAANVKDAFATRRPLAGAVVLVDDVVTTGETAHAAAQALRLAGATRVMVIAAARTPIRVGTTIH
jgi:ComF family protein